MAVARVVSVTQWRGRIVAEAEARNALGFAIGFECFGPMDDGAPNAELGEMVLTALDTNPPDPSSLPQVSPLAYVRALGAAREDELFGTGRAVVVSRRNGQTTVRAQGTDGGMVRHHVHADHRSRSP